MKYARETIATIKEDIAPLVQATYDEVEIDRDKLEFNLNWDIYHKLEELNILHIYTARVDGKMVGYLVLISSPSLHCSEHLMASSDVIYIHPEHRKGRAGANMIKYAEEDLKCRGVSVMIVAMKAHAPFDKLLQRVGYTFAEKTYQKFIGAK